MRRSLGIMITTSSCRSCYLCLSSRPLLRSYDPFTLFNHKYEKLEGSAAAATGLEGEGFFYADFDAAALVAGVDLAVLDLLQHCQTEGIEDGVYVVAGLC